MSANEARLPVATPAESRRLLVGLLRPHRWGVVGCALLALAATGSGLLVPPMVGLLVDVVQEGRPAADLVAPLVVLTVATLVQGVLAGVAITAVARVGERTLATLRERVMDRALAVSPARIERGGPGDLVARVGNDVDTVSDALRYAFPQFIVASLTVALTLVGLAVLDWRLALAGLVAVPFYVMAGRLYLRVSPRLYAETRRAEADRTQQLVETIGGRRTITSLLLGPRHMDRVAESSEHARRAHLRAIDAGAWFFTRIHMGELLGTASVLLVGTVLVDRGIVTLGAATAAALYFIRLFDPVGELLELLDEVQSATASLTRLAGVALLPAPDRDRAPEPAGAGVRIRDLRFGYDDGPDVLHGVDLDIAPGEHVAIVGASGAGKTTLAALLAGIHAPRAGTLEVGGVPVTAMGADQLAEHVALISQEVHVFSGPLEADLRLADPDAGDDRLREALARAGALGWADALPEGLGTAVGVGGLALDPVRAQQLAIARLVLRDPPVAVLDEATAEAGSAGARIVEAAMHRAIDGRTALLIAHRLSTAATADRVVVLDGGRVVEEGPPAELAAGDGPYAQLWAAWRRTR